MIKSQKGKTPKKTPSRKLYSTQTDPVEVFCRIRPLEDENAVSCVKVVGTNTLLLSAPENSLAAQAVRNGGVYKEVQNTFQHVFDERISQKALFDHVALTLVKDVLLGKNALLFAYGVTNSGKTHTMTGTAHEQGILPRCLDVIFNSLEDFQAKKYVFKPDKMNGFDIQSAADAMLERQRRDITPKMLSTGLQTPGQRDRDFYDNGSQINRVRDTTRVEVDEDNSYGVFVSYVEIYNNYIYDLLEELPYDPITGYRAPTSKILREDCNHNMYVSGVVEMEVKSTEEAYDLFYKGQKRRKVAHTALNTESSRSHSVFCIRVVQAPLDPVGEEILQDKDKVCVSQLALVDLAGSERTLRTGNAGDRLREAGSINQSLMVLRTCIETLRENQKFGTNKMVQYRDSRLTHLFKNYFDGEGKVRMIVCVNPCAVEYDETLQVMKFAEMTQEVQVARPMGAFFDVGLTPGRRRMHQQYKEALASLPQSDPNDAMLSDLHVFSMGPPFPSLILSDVGDDRTISALASFLKERETRRIALLSSLANKEEKFRSRLIDAESQSNDLRLRLADCESQLASKDAELAKLQKRLRSVEDCNKSLQRRTSMYEQERRDLEREIGEREWKILQEKVEKDRLRQDYKAKLVLTEQQFNQRIEQTTRKLKQENFAQLSAKQQKLDLLRNIINQDSDAASGGGGGTTPAVRLRATPASARYGASKVYPTQSEPDLSLMESNRMPPPTPKFVPRAAPYAAPSGKSAVSARLGRARSPPPVKPKPVLNAKFHRRSKSTSDDIWVDHRPEGTVEIGTLLQPKMKKRKSVATLNEKDTKDANKYVLTHQDLDSDGGIATKLVKGDILTTAGGGTAVIFNDVEVITKKSPGDRKRRSPDARPEDFDGEWTDTETRCNIALEGHGLGPKKPKV